MIALFGAMMLLLQSVASSFQMASAGMIDGYMKWYVIANVEMDGQVYEIPFLFDTFSAL